MCPGIERSTKSPSGIPTISFAPDAGVPGVRAIFRADVAQKRADEFSSSYGLNSALQVHRAFWRRNSALRELLIYFRAGSSHADRVAIEDLLRNSRLFVTVELLN